MFVKYTQGTWIAWGDQESWFLKNCVYNVHVFFLILMNLFGLNIYMYYNNSRNFPLKKLSVKWYF
jgi:hypothetical protein